MREYASVSPLVWIGKTGKSLRGHMEAQILLHYLISSPHSNSIGIYYLPFSYILNDTGLSEKGALKGLQRLSEASFMGYDRDSEVVFVREMAKWQIGESLHPSDKQVKGIQSLYDNLPENPFLPEFFDLYGERFHLKNRRGFEGASKDHRSTDTETETETEKEPPIVPHPKIPPTSRKKDPGQHYAPEFEIFWKVYPRKVGKEAAYKAWGKLKPPIEACLSTLEWQKESRDWLKDGGEYIPHPATWLNQKRWQDEKAVETWTAASSSGW